MMTLPDRPGRDASLVCVLSPADSAMAEQSNASTSGVYLYGPAGAPVDSSARRVWAVPVTPDLGLPAKTGLLLDREKQ